MDDDRFYKDPDAPEPVPPRTVLWITAAGLFGFGCWVFSIGKVLQWF